MALIVQKFGGSSLASTDRIKRVTDIILRTRQLGNEVVVVVSAMQGETDRLIQLATSFTDLPNLREYDAIVATGEQVSAALLSICLCANQCLARSFNASQVRIVTNEHHRKAKIVRIETAALRESLQQDIVPVVTGFQGVDEAGHFTTIGRGGSDMTAVALAAALSADECQIYTDVEGVFTTDPRVVKQARRLERITFDEMLELSNLGAKVLQIHAVEYANKHNVPLRVLSTFNEGPGTLITLENSDLAQPVVSGIAFDRNQAKLTLLGLPNQPGLTEVIMQSIRKAAIEVDMVIENVPSPDDHVDFSFTVHLDDYKQILTITEEIAQHLHAREVIANDRIAKLSVVGIGMKTHAAVANKMFHTLGEEGIKIHSITSSEVKISAVIDEKYIELGARALHSAFGLDEDRALSH